MEGVWQLCILSCGTGYDYLPSLCKEENGGIILSSHCFLFQQGQSSLAYSTSCGSPAGYPQQAYPPPTAFSPCGMRQEANRYPAYWPPDGEYPAGTLSSPSAADPQLLLQW